MVVKEPLILEPRQLSPFHPLDHGVLSFEDPQPRLGKYQLFTGVLDGHVDGHRITWIGHSRGGEGVARAYDRLWDGTWSPDNFVRTDIVLISSIAPTDFLGPAARRHTPRRIT